MRRPKEVIEAERKLMEDLRQKPRDAAKQAHWKSIVAGKPPFGWKVKEE